METLTITQKGPRYKIGDVVSFITKYGDKITGKIVADPERVYAEIDERGKFKRGGLHTLERTIKSICIPFEFDGNRLTVHYPASTGFGNAFTTVSLFHSWSYTVQGPQHLIGVPESKILR